MIASDSQTAILPSSSEGHFPLGGDVRADVARIEAAFSHARQTFGGAGPFLFGRFSAADAMFAPVVNRLHVYDIPVAKPARAYMEAVMALPAWKAWICLLYTSPSPRDRQKSRMPSSA